MPVLSTRLVPCENNTGTLGKLIETGLYFKKVNHISIPWVNTNTGWRVLCIICEASPITLTEIPKTGNREKNSQIANLGFLIPKRNGYRMFKRSGLYKDRNGVEIILSTLDITTNEDHIRTTIAKEYFEDLKATTTAFDKDTKFKGTAAETNERVNAVSNKLEIQALLRQADLKEGVARLKENKIFRTNRTDPKVGDKHEGEFCDDVQNPAIVYDEQSVDWILWTNKTEKKLQETVTLIRGLEMLRPWIIEHSEDVERLDSMNAKSSEEEKFRKKNMKFDLVNFPGMQKSHHAKMEATEYKQALSEIQGMFRREVGTAEKEAKEMTKYFESITNETEKSPKEWNDDLNTYSQSIRDADTALNAALTLKMGRACPENTKAAKTRDEVQDAHNARYTLQKIRANFNIDSDQLLIKKYIAWTSFEMERTQQLDIYIRKATEIRRLWSAHPKMVISNFVYVHVILERLQKFSEDVPIYNIWNQYKKYPGEWTDEAVKMFEEMIQKLVSDGIGYSEAAASTGLKSGGLAAKVKAVCGHCEKTGHGTDATKCKLNPRNKEFYNTKRAWEAKCNKGWKAKKDAGTWRDPDGGYTNPYKDS